MGFQGGRQFWTDSVRLLSGLVSMWAASSLFSSLCALGRQRIASPNVHVLATSLHALHFLISL